MNLLERDFKEYPKFRHNLWLRPEINPSITYLTVVQGTFEVPTKEAEKFLAIRTYCTGFNTLEEISQKSGVSLKEINSLLNPMIDAGILHQKILPTNKITPAQIQETFMTAARLFGEQLAETNISLDIFNGKLKKEIIFGWLSETYHYIKAFPEALEIAAKYASNEELKKLLERYAQQEKGHEVFILQSLMKAGFSKEEVEESTPLVSTKAIDLLFKELFAFEPSSSLIVASIVEAMDFDEKAAQSVAKKMNEIFNLPSTMWDPFFEHIKIDSKLGHQKLLEENAKFLKEIVHFKINDIMNKLHDIKHAFDLQKLEIIHHYGNTGSYLPRQKVYFFSI